MKTKSKKQFGNVKSDKVHKINEIKGFSKKSYTDQLPKIKVRNFTKIMTTAQLIEKKKKELDEKLSYYNDGRDEFGTNKTPNGWWIRAGMDGELDIKAIKSFLHSFALELIETVSEELIEKNLVDCGQPTEKYRQELQRQHKDEIISSIKK
jgi:hypothetical protein